MLEILCPFCRTIHRSEFLDEIEEEILRCRKTAKDEDKGLLALFDESEMQTVTTRVPGEPDDPFGLAWMGNDEGGP